jgi:acylphosphatase
MADTDEKRVLVLISGEVQGVGFRINCQREAMRLRLRGWVRNRWDGKVEALFEGPPPAVDAMIAWCRRGPAAATVDDVAVSDAPPGRRYGGFSVRADGND